MSDLSPPLGPKGVLPVVLSPPFPPSARSADVSPSLAAFMRHPALVLRGPSAGDVATPLRPDAARDMTRDVDALRRLVSDTDAALSALFDETPPSAPSAPPDPLAGPDALLREVRRLEERNAAGRLEQSALSAALRALYAAVLAEERRRDGRRAETSEDAVCDALRVKVREAQRRAWDQQRRADFMRAAEATYAAQAAEIHRLRSGRAAEVVEGVSTLHRHRWERRCARRVCGDAPTRGGGRSASTGEWDSVRRVLALPPGALCAMQDVAFGPDGRDARRVGSSGLRRRAQELGLRLQYERQLAGVRVAVEGERRLVEQFLQEIAAAVLKVRGGEGGRERRAPWHIATSREVNATRDAALSIALNTEHGEEEREWDAEALQREKA